MVDRSMPALLRSLRNRLTSVERRLARGSFQLPGRLSTVGQEVADWNDAIATGFYWSENTAVNGPYVDRFVGEVFVVGGGALAGRLVQEVRVPTNVIQGTVTWRRVFDTVWRPWYVVENMVRDLGARRTAAASRYWQLWQDTDGSQLLYVGNKSGGWRRFSGSGSQAERSWDTTQGASGNALVAGRSDDLTLPTVLLPNETVNVWMTEGGSGFTSLAISIITKNPTDTVVRVRFTQIASFVTQPYLYAWQIAQA